MVRIAYTLLAFASFFIAGLAAPATDNTFAKLKQDLSDLSTKTNSVKTAVNNLPPSHATLSNVVAIHIALEGAITTLMTSTTDAKATLPLSTDESQSISTSISALKGPVVDIATTIMNRKSSIASIPVSGTLKAVKQDVDNVKVAIDGLFSAMKPILKPGDAKIAASVQTEVDASLSACSQAYST